MDSLVQRIYVDDLVARRVVTTMYCFGASDLSPSADSQSERARASAGLHSWLRLWCSEVPGQICGSYPEISAVELQDSSGLTNIIILSCNYRIVDSL